MAGAEGFELLAYGFGDLPKQKLITINHTIQ
jgi:hypothetical protein